MRVAVTGAGGMLGSDVVLAAERAGHEAIGLTRADLDVADQGTVGATIERLLPDIVVNCAAWTDVDGAEADEAGATAINGEGARHVADAAAAIDAAVVYVSTDYVFDGEKGTAYVESDATAPISAYGRSKLAGEEATARANPDHFIVRASWLFGTGGPNFVETMLRLAGDLGEVLVVRDQVGCPTFTGHLAIAITKLIETPDFGIHHLAASGQCSWYEFAGEIFDRTETECSLLSGTSDMLARPAPRPALSVLRSMREDAIELPSWKRGLDAYLRERNTLRGAPGGSGDRASARPRPRRDRSAR